MIRSHMWFAQGPGTVCDQFYFLISSNRSRVVRSLAFLPKDFLARIMELLWAPTTKGCPFRKLWFCFSAYWKKRLKGHHRKRWLQHVETFLSRMGNSSIVLSPCSCFGLTASFLSWKKPKQNKKSREEWWSDQLCSLWVVGTCSGIEAKLAMTNTAPGGTFSKSIHHPLKR